MAILECISMKTCTHYGPACCMDEDPSDPCVETTALRLFSVTTLRERRNAMHAFLGSLQSALPPLIALVTSHGRDRVQPIFVCRALPQHSSCWQAIERDSSSDQAIKQMSAHSIVADTGSLEQVIRDAINHRALLTSLHVLGQQKRVTPEARRVNSIYSL